MCIHRSLHLCRGPQSAHSQEHTAGDLCGDSRGTQACQGGRHVRQDRCHGTLQAKGTWV